MSFITVNGVMGKDMVEDVSIGVMALCMKGTGKMIWPVVLEG
jgi:hypothetical protein